MEKKNLNLQLFAQEEVAGETEPFDGEQNPQEAAGTASEEAWRLALYRRHFQELERQAEELKTVFPDFDLRRELRNPVFARMTAPGVGLSVEDAYYAVHRRELHNAAIQAAKRQVSNAIATGARRPRENGLAGQAPAVSAFDYRSATKEQREDLKRRIRLAAAEGKKLYPGSR